MRHILVLFFMTVAVASYAQRPDQALPQLPYKTLYQNDFARDATGINNLAGELRLFDQANSQYIIGRSTAFGGVDIREVKVPNVRHRLIVRIDSLTPDASVRIYGQYATQIGTITQPGTYTYFFVPTTTSARTAVLVDGNGTGEIEKAYIGFISLAQIRPSRVIPSIEDVPTVESIGALGKAISYSAFSSSLDGMNVFNGGSVTYSSVNKNVVVGGDGGGTQGGKYDLGVNLIGDTKYVAVFNMDIPAGTTVRMIGRWDTEVTTFNQSGRHSVRWTQPAGSPSFGGDLILCPVGGTSFTLNSIWVGLDSEYAYAYTTDEINQRLPTTIPFDPNNHKVSLGGSNVPVDGVGIGQGASIDYSDWGTAVSGLERTAVGPFSRSHGWRTTAFGDRAHSIGQSSTAIGASSTSWVTHGIALGRGAFAGFFYGNSTPISTGQNADNIGGIVFDGNDLFLRNGWAEILPPGPSEVGAKTPGGASAKDIPIRIHGSDAGDARYPEWSNSITYAVKSMIWYNDKIYLARAVNSNQNPSTSSDWEFLFDDTLIGYGQPNGPYYQGPRDIATYGNKDGGPLELHGGKGVGTGEGGDVIIKLGTSANASPNVKNPERTVAKFAAVSSIQNGSRLMLLDEATNTFKRVIFKAHALDGTQGIIGQPKLSYE